MLVLKFVCVMLLALCSLSRTWAVQVEQQQWQGVSLSVVKVTDLSGLQLKLNNMRNEPYLTFEAIQAAQPKCPIGFAMNAGMFHADFSPVGLYIENKQIQQPLNTSKQGQGNFLIQPNGVVYWDRKTANVVTTAQYQQLKPQALFATQSGPMLVINGQVNSHFIANSDSKKLRNGVGIHQGQLWFVMAEQPINFYDFAQFFRDQLNIQQALYLDGGSVPSLYLPQQHRTLQRRFLGPMFVWQNPQQCR